MSINKAIVVGNLGRDPEIRALPSGQSVASFSIATTARFKDRNGEPQERTEWHRVVAFGRLADNCPRLSCEGEPGIHRRPFKHSPVPGKGWNRSPLPNRNRSTTAALARPPDQRHGGAPSGSIRGSPILNQIARIRNQTSRLQTSWSDPAAAAAA
jgi:single-strand DNA-binding protein